MTYCSSPYPAVRPDQQDDPTLPYDLLPKQYDLLFHILPCSMTYCLTNSMTYCPTPYPVLFDQQYDLLFHTLTNCLTNSMNYCSTPYQLFHTLPCSNLLPKQYDLLFHTLPCRMTYCLNCMTYCPNCMTYCPNNCSTPSVCPTGISTLAAGSESRISITTYHIGVI